MLFHTSQCGFNNVPVVSFAPFQAPMGSPPPPQLLGPQVTTFYADTIQTWQGPVQIGKFNSSPPASQGSASSTPPSLSSSGHSAHNSNAGNLNGFHSPSFGNSVLIASGNNMQHYHQQHNRNFSGISGGGSIPSSSNISPMPPVTMSPCTWNFSVPPASQPSQPIYVMLPPTPTPGRAGPAGAALPPTPTAEVPRRSNGMMYELGEWYEGFVKRYNPTRGFGFLTATHHLQIIPPNAGSCTGPRHDTEGENTEQPAPQSQPYIMKTPVSVGDVFVHQSYIRMEGFRALTAGDVVAFRVGKLSGKDAKQAVSVQVLGTTNATNGAAKDGVKAKASQDAGESDISELSTTQARHDSAANEDGTTGRGGPNLADGAGESASISMEMLFAQISGQSAVNDNTPVPSTFCEPASSLNPSTNEPRNDGGGDGGHGSYCGWTGDGVSGSGEFPLGNLLGGCVPDLRATDFNSGVNLHMQTAGWGMTSSSHGTPRPFGGLDER
ncbi:unnamed protein product [Trypanosoma congolense IL3000]|uniref:WGS project CAEQ00000000 data, annotated contig 2235 n=1 Tax=Trypanosoma congolense (strain IL3000) TaxID=1068625 RepID=F9WCI5_TRYCI|nr:unnamed protein product [Trypanosoma congolense IL3000]